MLGVRRQTDSTHGLPVYPNLIKNFIPTAPNQLWVSDITYIEIWLDATRYCFCNLSMILDAYTEEIVGWSVGPTKEKQTAAQKEEPAVSTSQPAAITMPQNV